MLKATIQQREELHKKIWSTSEKVRGAVEGWDFKQYILGFLFYRFISENIASYLNANHPELEALGKYENLNDDFASSYRQDCLQAKGLYIAPSLLFCNVVADARNNPTLGIDLRDIFTAIEQSAVGTPSEEQVAGLFADVDVTSNRLGSTPEEKNSRLVEILEGVAGIDFANLSNSDIDVFGDAYEFIISKYASNAGKSGGEYFTPQSVAKLVAQLVVDGKEQINKVYDPTCGSGSLLLQMKKQFDEHIIEGGFYGQDLNATNYNLARMNMFLHNVDYTKFSIKRGDTLTNPLHLEERFDAIVSNPPYSVKWIGDANKDLIKDPRFAPSGRLAPKNYADLAFVMHIVYQLSEVGRAVVVCFPGVFYRKGAELAIRKYLVDNNLVDCLIQLPTNMFFGTQIATTIIVLAKNKIDDKILFIDATNHCSKNGKANVFHDKHIATILDSFRSRSNEDCFASVVTNADVIANDYNLSVSQYVSKEPPVEKRAFNLEEMKAQYYEDLKRMLAYHHKEKLTMLETGDLMFGTNNAKEYQEWYAEQQRKKQILKTEERTS